MIAEDRPDGTTLTATLAWPGGLLDSADIDELAQLWRDALSALARCDHLAGHTPSDYPLVRLSQRDVDSLAQTGPVEDVLPLLPLQQGMYFHSVYGEGVDTYRVQQIAALSGRLDAARLRHSIDAVLRRHQALRAGFRELDDGTLAQVIWSDVEGKFESVDVGGVDPVEAQRRLDDIAREQLSRPFDLSETPLVRYTLVSLNATEHRLIQTMHHIIADGWSYPVIFGDLVADYNAAEAPEPVTTTLRDHVEAVLTGDGESARQAWARALDGAEPALLFDSEARGAGEELISPSRGACPRGTLAIELRLSR